MYYAEFCTALKSRATAKYRLLLWALLKCPHFDDSWTFTSLTNVYWSYHRQNMLLISHFDYWAFEPASSWAMLQGCRSDPLPFGRRKNPPTKIVAEISVCKFGGRKLSYETVSTTYTALYWISDNTSYSIRSALFTRVNPDRVTICDVIRRADAFLFLNIDASSCFLNKLRINIILIFSKKHHIFWR